MSLKRPRRGQSDLIPRHCCYKPQSADNWREWDWDESGIYKSDRKNTGCEARSQYQKKKQSLAHKEFSIHQSIFLLLK